MRDTGDARDGMGHGFLGGWGWIVGGMEQGSALLILFFLFRVLVNVIVGGIEERFGSYCIVVVSITSVKLRSVVEEKSSQVFRKKERKTQG